MLAKIGWYTAIDRVSLPSCIQPVHLPFSDSLVQAFASFIAALEADPEHLDSLLSCGNMQRSCLQLREAAELFKTAYALAPARKEIQSALSSVLTDLGEPSIAF